MDDDTQQAAEHQQQQDEQRRRESDWWAQYHDALCARQKREREAMREWNRKIRDVPF